jgi:hypothetical protein
MDIWFLILIKGSSSYDSRGGTIGKHTTRWGTRMPSPILATHEEISWPMSIWSSIIYVNHSLSCGVCTLLLQHVNRRRRVRCLLTLMRRSFKLLDAWVQRWLFEIIRGSLLTTFGGPLAIEIRRIHGSSACGGACLGKMTGQHNLCDLCFRLPLSGATA